MTQGDDAEPEVPRSATAGATGLSVDVAREVVARIRALQHGPPGGADDDDVDPRVLRTRRRVTDAAVELLVEGGLDALTPSAVAERSGVGRATIYRHWETPEELLVDVLSTHRPVPYEILAMEPPADLRDALVVALGALASTIRDDPLAGVMLSVIGRARHDERYRWVREQLLGGPIVLIEPLLVDAIAKGQLRPDIDPRDAGAMIGGATILRHLAFDEPPGPDFVERVVDGFLAAHRPPDVS